MKLKCFSSNCKNEPTRIFKCNENTITSCSTHTENHIDQCIIRTHDIESIYKNVNPGEKSKIIHSLKENIVKINKARIDCNNFYLNAYSEIEKNQKTVNQILQQTKQLIHKMIKDLLLKNKISLISSDFNQINLHVSAQEINYEIMSLLAKIKEFPKIVEVESISNLITQLENEKNTQTNNLYYFINNSSSLIILDTENMKQSQVKINYNDRFWNKVGICSIPYNKLFVSAGSGYNYSYIIDTVTGNAETMPSCRKKRLYATANYYKEKVYFFSGYDADYSCALVWSDCFDLKTKTWKNLPDLPHSPGYDSTAIVYNDKFIISTGNGQMIFEYDINKSTFSAISSEMSINNYNVLIKDNNLVYLLSQNSYVASLPNIRTWRKTTLNIPFTYQVLCKPVLRKRTAFMYTTNSGIIQFDLDTFQIKSLGMNFNQFY